MKPASYEKNKIDIKQFNRGLKIGKGGFGTVFIAEEIKTKKKCAVKILNCSDDESECNKLIDREVSIMMHIEHPTIIKFIGYSSVDFNNANNVVIFMELAPNGSLSDVIQNIMHGVGPIYYTNTTRQMILIGIARGMKYLHDSNIIHRDLKPGNILLDSEFKPLITDFGMAKYCEVGHSYSQSQFGGTKAYQAPEILRGEKYDGKVDVYAYGILMFEVLTDSFAYPELLNGTLNDLDFKNKVVYYHYRPKFTFPVKKALQQLTELCLSTNPDDRPSFDEIYEKLCDENYFLDNVDKDELSIYIDDITEVTDSTEKLLNKIKDLRKENLKLKTENKQNQNLIKQNRKEIRLGKKEIKQKNEEIEELRKLNQQQEARYKKELIHLKQTIKTLEEERQDLESNLARNNMKQAAQAIIVSGYDEFNQLGAKPNKNNYILFSQKPSIDPNSLLSFSTYGNHSIKITKNGKLLGIGNNKDGRISDSLPKQIITQFTEFTIKNPKGFNLNPVSAVCTEFGTLYMFSSGDEKQLVFCDRDINDGHPVFLNICNEQPVSLFGGFYHSAAITNKGEVIFINRDAVRKSPESPLKSVCLPDFEKAVSVACCNESVVALSSNGRVFLSAVESGSNVLNFSIVSELSDQEIVWVSGTNQHFLAVNRWGRVFARGSNEYGQLGLGQQTREVSSFTMISSLNGYMIRAAYAGCFHSLFETPKGKILSCGSNGYKELLLNNSTRENIFSPRETMITKLGEFCIAGNELSTVFYGGNPPPNTPNRLIENV